MSEYYIKQPNTDHARGPLSLDQLISMAETDSVNEDTLLYDELTEKWKPIAAFAEIAEVVFPQEKKLTLNRAEPAPTEDQVASEIAEGKESPKISAENILAAAAGETEDTAKIGNLRKSREKAAELAVPGIGALLLLGAFTSLYPAKDQLVEAYQTQVTFGTIAQPLVALGFVKLILAVLVLAGVTSIFPLIRISAGIYTGVAAYLFWAWDNSLLSFIALGYGFALFLSTFATRQSFMLFALVVGLISSITIGYAAVTGAMVYPF